MTRQLLVLNSVDDTERDMQIKIALAIALFLISPCLESIAIGADSLAAPVLVSNGRDEGPGSLRVAIRTAMPEGTIAFSFSGVISLKSELLIDKNLTITGPGSAVVTVSRNKDFGLRLLEVSAGAKVTISGLTFSGGGVEDLGGGILNHGLLTLNDVRVVDNAAIGGGFPFQTIANGGGCVNSEGAEMSLTNCTVSGNKSNGSGGGVLNAGTLTVENSTISGNSAAYGGGVSSGGTATITNCTISGNGAGATGPHGLQGGYGGGLNISGAVILSSDTISANHCLWDGGGMDAGNTVSITNCILADNTSQTHPDTRDIAGIVQSGGYNLVGVSTPGVGFGDTDLTGMSTARLHPQLGPL